MVTTYKLLTNQMKIEGEELFRMDNVTTRGHEHKLFNQHAIVRIDAFSYRIVTDWNSLPKEVVEAPTTDVFKERLGAHWKEMRFITPFS